MTAINSSFAVRLASVPAIWGVQKALNYLDRLTNFRRRSENPQGQVAIDENDSFLFAQLPSSQSSSCLPIVAAFLDTGRICRKNRSAFSAKTVSASSCDQPRWRTAHDAPSPCLIRSGQVTKSATLGC